MAWNPNYTQLNYLLADLYDDKDDSKALAKRAGLNTGLIGFEKQPYSNWFAILDGADKQAKVIALLEFIITPPELGSYDPGIKQAIEGYIDNLKRGKSPIVVKDVPAADVSDSLTGTLEKIMGSKSTLLPISFLEQGLICSKCVVRIETDDGLGSGFLVADNWVITNNHVIPDKKTAATAKVQFNYQKNIAGNDVPFKDFEIDGNDGCFHTSKEDDWTFIKLKEDANVLYGALTLSSNPIQRDEFVNIIQHPGGGPKQIALYHNNVTSASDQYVLYLTDTMNGSSGSPVFNTDWEVVALHHWGGTTKEAFPNSNLNVYRNRGINILRVRQALAERKIAGFA
jgi:V8-like Glu-specific endopeptidase